MKITRDPPLGVAFGTARIRPPADNQNLRHAKIPPPQRFTREEDLAVRALLGRYQRLGRLVDFHFKAEEGASCFRAINNRKSGNTLLTIRKFEKKEAGRLAVPAYGFECALIDVEMTWPDFEGFMKEISQMMTYLPQVAKPVVQLHRE